MMNIARPTAPTAIAPMTSEQESITNDTRTSSSPHKPQNHDYDYLSMPLKIEDDEDNDFDLLNDIHNQFNAINLIEDSIAEVQQVEQESRMRAEMQKLLELCLQAQDNKCDMTPPQPKQSLRKLAKLLESRLYQSAISFESYCDLSTLQSRMKVVLYHLKKQRRQSKRRKSCLNQQKRSAILRGKLGLSHYARAERLVQDIQQRKNILAGQSCPKCQINGNCTNLQFSSQTIAFGESLPIPVQNLFFRTPFVQVFSKYPLERIESLGWQRLYQMMEQAERHMEDYDSWMLLNED